MVEIENMAIDFFISHLNFELEHFEIESATRNALHVFVTPPIRRVCVIIEYSAPQF